MGRSDILYKLQQIDSSIDSSKKRIAEINRLLEDDSELQSAAQEEKILRETLAERRSQLRAAEDKVEDQEYKIERNRKKLYGGGVTNPKELEDLQMESQALEEYLTILEDRQLEQMVAHEEAEQDHQTALKTLEAVQQSWDETVQALQAEKENLIRQTADLKTRRENLTPEIPAEDLQRYEEIRRNSGGVAVAAFEAQSCQACGSQVPSALAQQASSPSQLARCGTCGRILHRAR